MKLKYLSILIMFFVIGVSYQVQAQEEETEGEDFWTEESAETSESSQVKESANTKKDSNKPKVKPVSNSCSNKTELREEARLLLRPYKYNLAKTTIINFKRYPQLMRVLIPIYSDQEHRLIFSTKGLPQEIGITIYDKPKGEKRRKAIFTTSPGEPISTFQLPEDYKESYLFVEYAVPASEADNRSTTIRGCAIMMMGYLYLPKTEGESTVDTDDGKKKKK